MLVTIAFFFPEEQKKSSLKKKLVIFQFKIWQKGIPWWSSG